MAYKVGRCLLRYRLKDAKMNQEELSVKLGVTSQQVNKYVRNRQKMSLQVAKNIASILDCQMEDLYEWIEAGDNE
ncbi:helix-turn-helix transcriptional regulator [Virgibacillus salexigens]|uniref:helix-turn-helix transcriptional regulator n=1 Tax=Virgibacillus salexigens TaxID=61016 RepID=UPI00190DBD31|nr:helix-turn-helix transcriptional regulator [Virgibacillus salexigens]